MRISKSTLCIWGAWLVLAGGYAAVSLAARFGVFPQLAPGSRGLTVLADILQCLVPLVANAGLLLNASSPQRRANIFWMFLALGCTLWLVGQLTWTYQEVVLQQPVPLMFWGDAIFFFHTVPMIGALALRPHARHIAPAQRPGYLDFLLLLFWWVYLYLFAISPWQYVLPDTLLYGRNFNQLYLAENSILVVGLGAFCLVSRGKWRTIYAHLFGAASLYTLGSQAVNLALDQGRYFSGSLLDVPLVASFVWFGTAGVIAHRVAPLSLPEPESKPARSNWPALVVMACVLSMPLLAAWSIFLSEAPGEVREFRALLTLGALFVGTALVFLRQHFVDQERLQLLRASQDALENLRRLQTQFIQSEKLASLGQLAAGAAHEINNPLTAILGYADLLIDDPSLGEQQHSFAERLREQARRTTTLLSNLLSFAREVPVEKTPLDVNAILTSALQLRTLDLREKDIRIELQTEGVVPSVRGDPNQLLQVFFNIISNAVDAMEERGGGVLTVRTQRERANVVIEFSDTGPGIREPHLVFDPFYTTKAVGKGSGLGLSICYGLVKEHGGQITCYNRPGGGATFRVELPAVIALFPQQAAVPSPTNKSSQMP